MIALATPPPTSRSARLPVWSKDATWVSNKARTLCYHFATQFGNTRRYGQEQGRTLERSSLDNSGLAATEQNTTRWPQPKFECGAFNHSATSPVSRHSAAVVSGFYRSGAQETSATAWGWYSPVVLLFIPPPRSTELGFTRVRHV